MLLWGLVGALCGLLLGRRHSIFVLVPAHLVALGFAGAMTVVQGHVGAKTIVALVAWSIACQLGFLIAAALAGAPARRAGPPRLPTRARQAR